MMLVTKFYRIFHIVDVDLSLREMANNDFNAESNVVQIL